MYKTILATALLVFTVNGIAESVCFGPGGCQPVVEPTGPADLCLPEGCNPVSYTRQNGFAIAESRLPNGWPVMGWSGPCLEGATIQTAAWTVIGGTAAHSAVVDSVAYVWLSVTSGATTVEATVHIVLDTAPVALQDERTLILTVKER